MNQLTPTNIDQRILNIENKLNYLCCQHDSLMPILQIHQWSTQTNRWETSLKNIHKKLHQYQNSYHQLISHQHNHTQGQKNAEHNKKLDQLKINLKRLKQTLAQMKNEKFQNPTQELINKDEVNNIIEQAQRYTQISLASFSNEIELNSKIQQSKPIDTAKMNHMVKSLMEDIGDDYTQMKEDIEVIKSNLPSADISKFHEFTYQRLGCELVEINETVEQIFGFIEENNVIDEENKNKTIRLKERFEVVGWQIQGMKKKYLHELTLKYEEDSDKYETNCLEKRLMSDIRELDSSLEIILNKFTYLENEITKI